MDKNTYYTDVRILADPVPVIIGHLVSRIHGFSVKNGGEFNLALPQLKTGNRPKLGNILRVFGDKDLLNNLIDDLDKDHRETYLTTRVKTTPETQAYVAYIRMRLPARSSINAKRQAHTAIDQRNRFSRLESYKSMPYFSLKSQSNRQVFPVVIDKLKKGVKDNRNAIVGNGYGFSTATQIVWVPDFN